MSATRTKVTAAQEALTARVIEAIEADPGQWSRPWREAAAAQGLPRNVVTGATYRGANVLNLWFEAMLHGWGTGAWAGIHQWNEKGCRVRKGQRGTVGIYWRQATRETDETDPDTGERVTVSRMVPGVFRVWNLSQVEGEWADQLRSAPDSGATPLDSCEAWMAATGARVEHRSGEGAYFAPTDDRVVLPPIAAFPDPVAYYSTAAHELTHWTGHPDRLARDLTGRFGSDAYAMEELTAELGSIFVGAALRIETEPRADHAQYLAHWLRVLKSNPSHLWTVATAAAAAAEYLNPSPFALTQELAA